MMYNKNMDANDSAPADLNPGTPTRQPSTRMDVQCTHCGKIQELDPEYRICLNCGSPVSERDSLILANPRKGRGMQGAAVLAFALFLFVFFFWSKYIGRHGMGISALFYIWGFYKHYLYKREAAGRLRPSLCGAEKNGDPRKS